MMHYKFDGSYIGLLSVVFESFERNEFQIIPTPNKLASQSLFTDCRTIASDTEKASRVQKGLIKRIGKQASMEIYCVSLSEDSRAHLAVFQILVRIFKGQHNLLQNFGDPEVLFFHQTLKKVSRERHRMKAFVRFSQSEDGLYVASIEPDFNVLPLIISFFKKRFADQSWLIYDVKRKYGWLYDQTQLTEIELVTESDTLPGLRALTWHSEDEQIQNLWKQYFNSTTIAERKNLRLHIKHVPRRYWKYLIEKQ